MSGVRRNESALPEPELRDPELWVLMSKAPDLIGKPRRTIYRWVKCGDIRVYRPRHELFLYIPDLQAKADRMIRRVAFD